MNGSTGTWAGISVAIQSSADGFTAIGAQAWQYATATTGVVLFQAPTGGGGSVSVHCYVAPTSTGIYVDQGAVTTGSNFTFTGLSPSTQYECYQNAIDTNGDSAVGAVITFTTPATSNYLLDTFTAPTGTLMLGASGHISDSGSAYSDNTNNLSDACKIVSNSPYSATGTNDWNIANIPLDINAPSAATFTLTGSAMATNRNFQVCVRCGGGKCYAVNYNADTQAVVLSYYSTPTASSGLNSITITTPTAGSYTLTLAPHGIFLYVYLYNNTTGMYLVAANTYQATKAPLLTGADANILTAGSPGIRYSFESSDAQLRRQSPSFRPGPTYFCRPTSDAVVTQITFGSTSCPSKAASARSRVHFRGLYSQAAAIRRSAQSYPTRPTLILRQWHRQLITTRLWRRMAAVIQSIPRPFQSRLMRRPR